MLIVCEVLPIYIAGFPQPGLTCSVARVCEAAVLLTSSG